MPPTVPIYASDSTDLCLLLYWSVPLTIGYWSMSWSTIRTFTRY